MGTSRGVLHERETYIIGLKEGDLFGLGECAPVPGLSMDAVSGLEEKLEQVCGALSTGATQAELDLADWPAIRFGVESAFLDVERCGRQRIFDTPFTTGKSSIPSNGLIIMSEVPVGGGLSSSAALEVAVARARCRALSVLPRVQRLPVAA
ncbi:hypothetical protein IIA29_05290, partial [candidate division KSB1 bacterium]|nr:hypothetical protein [candidate division KSB1 bacterium]